ncbi:hepatitis A virus cellular receptor 1 [Echinops telfairi]|uniref:Hepatitis A virus cellular receptor 1 n=1 Tax=Echinops telfairi TaxID=9371 RepID=A0AC55CNK9_ECHTE|nr:hepatitis A virus cellular receptor 1 [Echinops telfairi]
MHPQVAISSLILLLADAVASYPKVSGFVGQPVTIPCTYSGELTSTCWGRGACPSSKCSDVIIWTHGSSVTYRKESRYMLNGSLWERNVSLTIGNAVEADSGLYCCRIEHRGWFNDEKHTISLEVIAVPIVTSPSPTQTAITQPKTAQQTEAQATSLPWSSCSTADGNGTVTQSSDGFWHNNQTEVSLVQETQRTAAKEVYIGIGIFAAVLLCLLVVLIIRKQFYMRNKLQQLRVVTFNAPQSGVLQNAAGRAEDNVYIIEENLYVMD